jgi:hypothetical protein
VRSAIFGWRESRERKRRARAYVRHLVVEPAEAQVRELASVADHDDDHARWEWRYARRALGLITAERDALDDRTSADVARALEDAWDVDPHVAPDRRPLADRQLNERIAAYRAATLDRTSEEALGDRLARVLLHFAGAEAPDARALALMATAIAECAAECNAQLRATYGEASLPPDVKPSALVHTV